MRNLRKAFLMGLFTAALIASGCTGDTGPAGSAGGVGPTGATGADGAMGTPGPQGPAAPSGLPLSIQLPGINFFPEGIARDNNGNFYVGSVTTGQVIKAGLLGDNLRAQDFATGQLAGGAIGMEFDADLGVLWVCDSNPTSPTASSLVGFDVGDGSSPAVTHALPTAASGIFCNDIALDDANNVYFTDSLAGRIFRIPEGNRLDIDSATEWIADDALAGIDADAAFGANGIVHLGGFIYALNYAKGTLLQIAIGTGGDAGEVKEVALSDGTNAYSIAGGDGLKVLNSTSLIVVENLANKLTLIDLADVATTPTGTVKPLATRLDVPTTVELVLDPPGQESAFVVESQFDHLLAPDTAGPPALPFGVVEINLFLPAPAPSLTE